MPTLKRKNANGQWEYIQVSGLDVSQLKDEVDSVTIALADKASQASLNTTNANVSTNTAQLAAISKLTINALYPPTGLTPALFDGTTDDSSSLQAMINYLQTNGGGVLELPRGKTTKCNITISSNFITLQGQGSGTLLQPYDLTKPVLSVGNKTTQILKITIKDLRLLGDSLTTTSDGLVIDGVTYLTVDNLYIVNFGGDNIRITSTGTQPTQFLNFSNINTKSALGSCLNVNYGTAWSTAIYFNGLYIEGKNATGATAINMNGIVNIGIVNAWIQIGGDSKGHIVMNNNSNFISGSFQLDGGGTGLIGVVINSNKTLPSTYFRGYIVINAKIKYSDGSTVTQNAFQGSMPYHTGLSYPIVQNSLLMGDKSLTADAIANLTESNTMGVYNQSGTLYIQPLGSNSATNLGMIFWGMAGTPASSTATGIKGQMMWDATYFYFCIATNSWARIARDTTAW